MIVILIIILGAIGYFFSKSLKEKPKTKEEILKQEETTKEIFSLQATVLMINVQNNFLMVKPMGKENKVKVIISDNAKLTKLSTPFDPNNPPPPGTQFIPKETKITLKDFKIGDQILIESNQNIAGRNEVGDINFINILS